MNNKKARYYQQCSQEIDQICAPLKEGFGITSLVYVKNYYDGSEIRLTNQPQWVDHFYTKEYYKKSLLDAHPSKFQTGFTLLRDLKHHDIILQDAFEFNIAHGITLTIKNEDSVEFFFLCTERDNDRIIPLFLNNMDLLERFTVYFKERAQRLIFQAEKNKLTLDKNYEYDIPEDETAFIFAKNGMDREGFLSEVVAKELVLDKNLIFTKREIDVIQCLVQGKTAKEAGQFLFVSPRTIETHINHIKDKLSVRTRSALIGRLLELGFK